MSICFSCGKRLTAGPVIRDYHGAQVSFHKVCAKTFDESKDLSARATTSESGSVGCLEDDWDRIARTDEPRPERPLDFGSGR